MPDPAPENEHAEARGPASEDTDGEVHDEARGPGEVIGTVEVENVDPALVELLAGGPIEDRPEADLVTFDLETGDADDLYREDGADYIRIGGTAADGEEVVDYRRHVPRAVAADIRAGRTITGHNIMAFDLPALVRSGAMTMTEIHDMAAAGRLADALIMARYIDPPMARDKGVDADRKYDLGSLGEKLGLGEKLTGVSKPLAKKYGGWGAIPFDPEDPDPERAADAADFIGYLRQDVELSRKLYRVLLAELGGTMPDYLVREHKIAAVAAQITHNGFLVDQELLGQRVREIEQTKRKALSYLSGTYGVPLVDAKGVAYKSPLATKGGKEAIGKALAEFGVPSRALWRTPTSGDLQLSAEAMLFYGREYGQNRPELRKLCTAVYRIVSARSVYETAMHTMMPDGRCHPQVSFKQATGRWSLTKPGLTVFGKRGGRHVERAVFLPDPGEVLLSVDLSQVDMRAVAGLSQDQAYIRMLEAEDPHAELAELLLGDRREREKAKPIGHGWNYGRGVRAISQANDIDPTIVIKFDQSMRERFPRLVQWREEVRALGESGALLDNGFGRLMRPDPRRSHTQSPALMGQGAARDIMMTGLLNLDRRILPMLRAQVHDEVVFSVPSGDAQEVGRAVVEALSFEWRGVSILADVSRTGTDWSKCYEK
jgi:DNA polymerase-1